jgi:hypothetical protein
MLKKIMLVVLAFSFAFFVLGISVFRASASVENNISSPSTKPVIEFVDKEESTSEAEKNSVQNGKKIEYQLAYPGILPDHPLYKLKMVRDRIWLFLTTNPTNKAEVLLLFADKRIYAATSLVDKGKIELGWTTATKAEKYLERAVNQALKLENEENVQPFLNKLATAIKKHEEVLIQLSQKTEDSRFKQLLTYSQQGLEKINQKLQEK